MNIRVFTGIVILVALLALLGMGLYSPVIDSITYRAMDNESLLHSRIPMQAPYVATGNTLQEASIKIWYRGYGNSTLMLAPRYCFYKGYSINAVHHDFPNHEDHWCQPLLLDLNAELLHGDNVLMIKTGPAATVPERYSPHVGLTIGPLLFGSSVGQTIFTCVFAAASLTLLWVYLGTQGFNIIIRVMFIIICVLLLDCLRTIPQYGYTLDLEKHIPYLQYMVDHPLNAHGYKGPESWHPALYYQVCAWVESIFQSVGVFDPWTGIRLFSMCCYVVFLYYGMLSLRRIFTGMPLYLSIGLLLFWPSGLLSAAWFFNDVLVYPLYGASFYYTLVWYESKSASALAKSLILCGICFTVKTTALVPTTILGACMVARWVRRDVALKSFFTRPQIIAAGVFILGILSNFAGVIYGKITGDMPPPHLGGDGGYYPTFANYFLVDLRDLLNTPFFNSWDAPDLWVVTIKTLLFTNSYWNQPLLGSSLMLLLFIMGAYGIVFLLTLGLQRAALLLPIVLGCIVPFMALLSFTLLAHNSACRDFRYVQPALTAMIAIFMLAVQETKHKNYIILYYAGSVVAALFPIFSVAIYIYQMHP